MEALDSASAACPSVISCKQASICCLPAYQHPFTAFIQSHKNRFTKNLKNICLSTLDQQDFMHEVQFYAAY